MREHVALFGDPAYRPEGLEQALVRGGFALAEARVGAVVVVPDIVLVAVPDEGLELQQALETFRTKPWAGVPVIVLLAGTDRDAIVRALELGATDVLAAPINLGELTARLESSLRNRAEQRRTAGLGVLQADLFRALEEIASARHPDEMLERLTRRLGAELGAAHCACLAPSEDRRYARVVAVHENPTLRNVSVDLFRYPEVVEVAISCRTFYAPEVLRDRLFLTHLAQWPDSPEVHEIESAAAVPLITHGVVRAAVVLRTRRGEPALAPEQVALVEQLVSATATLVAREERRADVSRRHNLAASTDPLTRCASLDALDRRLRDELERARRYGSQLALALLEVDALHELNTRPGEAVGDRFLAELGCLLLQEIRSPDFVARYGSDEFAVLMPSTGLEGGRQLLARIATRLSDHPLHQFGISKAPRLAAGLVVYPYRGLSRVEDLLAAAEAALARGKANPVDRVGLPDSAAA
jgi:diguanylate cyclase (GGDEF)-like protein